MLLRSIYLLVAPVMLVFAALACGTVVTDSAYLHLPDSDPDSRQPPTAGRHSRCQRCATAAHTLHASRRRRISTSAMRSSSVSPARRCACASACKMCRSASTAAGGSPRNLVTWRLEIRNLGSATYETVPVALMVITRINTASGEQTGTWHTSEAAMTAAGFTNENYDPLTPGSTRVYRLAAYIPAGSVRQFAYLLDGDGGNRITWVNAANPYCSGDVAG